MRFKFQNRFLLIFVLTLIGLATTWSWRLYQSHEDERARVAREISATFANQQSHFFSDKVRRLSESLTGYQSKRSTSDDLRKHVLAQDFSAIAYLQTGSDGKWHPKWIDILGNQTPGIPSVAFERVDAGFSDKGMRVSVVELDNLAGYLSISIPQGADRLVGLTDVQWFSKDLQSFKAGFVTVFIVNEEGLVVGHTRSQAMGIKSDHPIVPSLVAKKTTSGTREFQGQTGPGMSAYEPIANTNLSVVASLPLSAISASATQSLLGVLSLAMGFLLIGAVLFFHFGTALSHEFEKILNGLKKLSLGEFENLGLPDRRGEFGVVTSLIEDVSLAVQKRHRDDMDRASAMTKQSKLEALEQVGRGLADELRSPVAAVIGHVQLAKNKAASPEANKHLDFIEKETRQIRDLIERIRQTGFYRSVEMKSVALGEVLEGALERLSPELEVLGVKIHKDFYPVPEIRASQDLKSSLSDMILSVAKSALGASQKDLILHLEPDSEATNRLRLEIPGGASTAETWVRMLEPFQGGQGLGLSTQKAVIEAHGGRISTQDRGNGETHLIVDLPTVTSQAVQDSVVGRVEGRSEAMRAAPSEEGRAEAVRGLGFVEKSVETVDSVFTQKKLSQVLTELKENERAEAPMKDSPMWNPPEPPRFESVVVKRVIQPLDGMDVSIRPPKVKAPT